VKPGARGGAPAAVTGLHAAAGFTLIELLLVMGLLATVASMTVPVAAQAIDAGRARHAAGFVASRLRMARMDAVQKIRSVGVVFRLSGGRWTFSICEDGNGNGMRTADIAAGVDRCLEGPHDLQAMFSGTSIAVDPTIPGPEGSPASADPVRFGASDIASFSSIGSCTPGTLYLRSERGVQYAVRVGGATGRTRVLKFNQGSGTWGPG
jgi:prepilin-type N-terminal cleavage/methylation domain-containing protein